MRIKRLRIAGFKSFVDPADLRIEPGLTGVVGPNGCGKSNLLEALRWTMGENSAKSMRGAGMDDVIFAGTATRPPRDFAEVSILAEIDGPDGPDESEIVRRIERGAGSAYRIDGRDVRAKDVALLFADAATGAHSPALVSQGRIGAVIAARPAERRAMLEEAAGIAGLHVRRRDAEARLRATEANLQRLDEVVADQQGRVASLRRQARTAERYRALSDQIRVAEARMIFARWRDAVAAADAAKADAATAEARVSDAAAVQAAATALQADAAATVTAARDAALAARDRASEAAHRLQGLRHDKATVDRRIAELAEARARIADDRAREGSLASDAATALARLATDAEALEAAIAAAAADAPGLAVALVEAERHGRDAEVALAQAMGRQASEAAEARVAAAALAAARTRADRAGREGAAARAAIIALGEPAPLESERAVAAARRIAAAAEGEDARRSLSTAEQGERTAIARRDAAEVTRAAARADLAALDSEAAALTRATQRTGRDRLLDHLTPAPGYERALAAALGDDLEAGLDAKAQAYWAGAEALPDDPGFGDALKDASSSVRAEPVEARGLGARPSTGSGRTEEGDGSRSPADGELLADHVTAPPQLARRLAQVIVVEQDAGHPLAAGQRLVTRDGVLRRWDGFVARGTGAPAAERLERLNRLRHLAERRPAALTAVEQAETERAAVDAAIAAARQAAYAARTTLNRAENDARDAQRAEDRAAAALERLAGQRADLDAHAARAEAEQAEAAAELGCAEAAAAALPDTAAATATVASLGRDVAAARNAIAAARERRAAAERDLAGSRERLVAAQADTSSWRARAGDAASRIADMDRRAEALARDAAEIADRPAALAEAVAAGETEHTAARASTDTLAAAERDADAALRQTEEKLRRATDALADAREGRAAAMARVESQELRRVEMGRLSGERFECPAPVLPERLGFASDTVRDPGAEGAAHERLAAERERIGPVNLVAAQELAELEAAAAGLVAEREELGQAVNRLRGSIGTLNREGRQRLRAAFEAVDGHFRRLFTTLFDAGDGHRGQAHLALVDSDDPLYAGLEIMAQPPGKRLQSLTLLSGGEQALTAVALIFALFLTNPAPICVLDEVDAPLDDANIERFCGLLDRMTRETDTRYLIVTHNAVTMSRMHRLFGVTMIEKGVSRLVSVDLQAAETLLAAE